MKNLSPKIQSNKLGYTLVGGYCFPELKNSEENRPIGRWGRLHRQYLKENYPIRYNELVLSGKLWTYLADLNEQAQNRLELLISQAQEAEGIMVEPKACGQMECVRQMRNIRNRAEEVILAELIYV